MQWDEWLRQTGQRYADEPLPEEPDAGHLDDWRDQAKCLGTPIETFYEDESTGLAKFICNGGMGSAPCPVRQACLDYALDNGERYGVWGGLSEWELRHLQKGKVA